MKSLNKAELIGYIGSDINYITTNKESGFVKFTLATSESWVKDGNKVESTEWHKIVAYDKLADICNDFLKKGDRVYISGKLSTYKWEDKNGNDRYTTQIVCKDIIMLSLRDESLKSSKTDLLKESKIYVSNVDDIVKDSLEENKKYNPSQPLKLGLIHTFKNENKYDKISPSYSEENKFTDDDIPF